MALVTLAVDLAADGVGNVVAQTLAGFFFTSAAQTADQSAEYAGIGIGSFFLRLFCAFFSCSLAAFAASFSVAAWLSASASASKAE